MSRWFVCYLGHRNYITLAIFKSNLINLDLFVVLCSSSFDSKAKTTIIYLYVGSRWIQTAKHWEFYWASTHSSFIAWFLRVLPISLLTLHRDNTCPYFLNRLTFLRGSLVKLFPHKYVLWILQSRAFIHKWHAYHTHNFSARVLVLSHGTDSSTCLVLRGLKIFGKTSLSTLLSISHAIYPGVACIFVQKTTRAW